MDVQHFATGAYIVLLFTLIFFVALSAVLLIILKKEITSSLGREKEGTAWSHAVLLAQEDERSRISRELHDTVVQDLRYLSLNMHKIAAIEEAPERKEHCAEAASHLLDLVRRVRDTCDYLVPPSFRFQELSNALRHLCIGFSKRTGIECHADIAEAPAAVSLDSQKQLQIFRIIQEALVNVEKHARAGKATVMFHHDADGRILVGVFDDGEGFDSRLYLSGDPQYATSVKTMGLRGMTERAALLNGEFSISSEPGEGTSIRLVISPQTSIKRQGEAG